jgi:hypothetical protein
MRLRAAITCVLTAAFAVGLAGVSTAKPLSAGDFREAADAICAEGNAALAEAASQYFPRGTEPDLATVEAYAAEVEPIVQNQIEQIAELQPPKKLKKKVKALLSTARDELEAFVDDPTILLESDPFADTKARSAKLGLEECAG